MPCVVRLDGMKINVHTNDHPPPHIHAVYGEFEALIVIADGTILEGSLPAPQLAKARAFVASNREPLLLRFKALNP